VTQQAMSKEPAVGNKKIHRLLYSLLL